MGSTNKTTNYNLPQFVGSDKPTFMGDLNGAFNAIDTALKALEDSVSGVDLTTLNTAVTNLQSAVTALQGVDTNVNTKIGTIETAISNINTAIAIIGTGSLDTTAQNIISAVNEVRSVAVVAKSTVDSMVKFVTLTGTLTAGQTSLEFTNDAITDTALIDIYTPNGVAVKEKAITGTKLTLTFDAQESNVTVKVRIS